MENKVRLPSLSTYCDLKTTDSIRKVWSHEPMELDTESAQCPSDVPDASSLLKQIQTLISDELEQKKQDFLMKISHQLKNFELIWNRDQENEKKMSYMNLEAIQKENDQLKKNIQRGTESYRLLMDSKNHAIQRLDQMFRESNVKNLQLSNHCDELRLVARNLQNNLVNSFQEITYLRNHLTSLGMEKNMENEKLRKRLDDLREQVEKSQGLVVDELKEKVNKQRRKCRSAVKEIEHLEKKLEHREKTSQTYYDRSLKLEGELSELYKKLEKYEAAKKNTPTSSSKNRPSSSTPKISNESESRKRGHGERDKDLHTLKIQKKGI